MSEKKVGKRLLTWVLVLVMTLSLLPLNVLAAEVGETQDVIYGHYEGNNWTLGPDTNAPSLPKGVDSVNKTAVPVGDPKDNTYQVTLEVQMRETTTVTSPEAAAVLVIDISNSMKECLETGRWHDLGSHKNCKSRLDVAKDAATSFVSTYAGTVENSGRYLAIVLFNYNSHTDLEWTDVSTSSGKQTAIDRINNIGYGSKDDGGTNLEQGLALANDLLTTVPSENISVKNKNVIALTDGAPTRAGTNSDTSEGSAAINAATADTANAVKLQANLYTVCFGAESEYTWEEYIETGFWERYWEYGPTVGDFLRDSIASGSQYAFNANNRSELNRAFSNISEEITSGLSSGKVHDSLPTGVTSMAIPSGTVEWDLKDFEKDEEKVGDTTTYTYTKTYTVKIDPTDEAVAGKDYYPLNGPTTLTVKDSNNEDVTIDFPIPAGKVTLPKYTLTYNANGGSGVPDPVSGIPATKDYALDSTTTPTKAADADYTYSFKGWGTSANATTTVTTVDIEGDTTVYAVWEKHQIAKYTLTYDANGGSGEPAAVSGIPATKDYALDSTTTPTKAADDDYTYTFKGWGTSADATTTITTVDIEGNTTVYAVWERHQIAKYTVTWVNWNGDLLDKDENVKYNSTPSYDGKTPTRPASGRYTYTFNGWTPALSPVTGDITYTATYKSTYHRPSTPTKPTVEIEDDDALGLNTTDHFAYIVGYGNGEVRPQNNITRAEVATIFFRLLTDDVRDENLTKTNRYSDVTRADWYNTAVSTLSSMGIITGYPDGTFRPNAAITRAEFAAIAARFDSNGDKTTAKFSDIATHWAKDEISIAYNNGWINGYPNGTFGPQRDITRAETMTLVNRVLNRQPETENDLLPNMTVWTDNANPNAWYYLAVQEATNSHYYKFKTNSKYEKWTELRETRDWTQLEK